MYRSWTPSQSPCTHCGSTSYSTCTRYELTWYSPCTHCGWTCHRPCAHRGPIRDATSLQAQWFPSDCPRSLKERAREGENGVRYKLFVPIIFLVCWSTPLPVCLVELLNQVRPSCLSPANPIKPHDRQDKIWHIAKAYLSRDHQLPRFSYLPTPPLLKYNGSLL